MSNKPTNSELILGIPINKYELQKDHVVLYSDNQHIGSIPFFKLGDDTLMYDKDESNLNRLKWDLIYLRYKEKIDNRLKELFETDELEITLGTFRKLYVKQLLDNTVKRVDCHYYEKEWHIRII